MPFRRQSEFVFLICVAGLLACGCTSALPAGGNVAELKQQLRKPISPRAKERLLEPGRLSSIGQMARIDGLDPLPCAAAGLVTGLNGNGADKHAMDRDLLSEVKKTLITEEGRTLAEANEMVDGEKTARDSSVVHVTAAVPAGAPPGALFDAYVRCLDPAVTLQNGYLHKTPLRKYIVYKGQTVTGDIIAYAGGPVTAGGVEGTTVMAADESGRTGVVFDGCRAQGERIFLLIFQGRTASASRAVLAEYLINSRFANVARQPGMPPTTYATAVSGYVVQIRIPAVYRRYVERFAQVLKQLRGSYFYGPPSSGELEKLSSRLAGGNAKEKYQASVELEAVGAAAVPYLESAAQAGDDWTALYAGQALCFLESPKGPERIYALADSKDEAVRLEAVRFVAQLAGRKPVQVLRMRISDPSDKVALEAVKGLILSPEDAAGQIRLSRFDMVAVPGTEPGLIVKSTGRPMVVVASPGTLLKPPIEIAMPGLAIGSVDDRNVAITTGTGPDIETVQVEATADNILAVLGRFNPPFDTVRKVIEALEDARNIPYKVRYLD